MLLKPITVAAAGLAAATHAFLLPPEVSESDVNIVNTIDVVPEIAKARVVELPCNGCPIQFLGKGGRVHVKTDKPNHLLLAFAIDQQPGSDRLLLNDFELYPHSDPFHSNLVAPQVPDSHWHEGRPGKKEWKDEEHKKWKDAGRKHNKHRRPVLSPQLGFGLQVHPAMTSEEDNFQVIALDLQIIEVGTTFVDAIPNVHIKLLKDPNGRLMIGGIETTTSQNLQGTPMEKQEECTTLLCKWLTIIQDKFKGMKGIKKHCHGNKQVTGETGAERTHKHHGDRPHTMGHGPDGRRSWRRLMKNIVSHILLPVFIGIVAGISVSLVGMVFGSLTVSLWRLFRRPSRRHAGHSHHRAARKEVAAVEEKSGLMDHQDPPPEYEDEVSKEPTV